LSTRSRGAGLIGALLVLVQLGVLALVALGPRTLPGQGDWPEPWSTAARVAGVLLAICGGLLALDAALRIGWRLTPSPHPPQGARLVVKGAFGLVRHPMYGGLILTAFGWGLFVNGPLTLLYACLVFAVLDLKARFEERLLLARFAAYADYRARVSKLVPFLY
jgi:protein-S-isoprenylcysteine O-methyltransferase Ste14